MAKRFARDIHWNMRAKQLFERLERAGRSMRHLGRMLGDPTPAPGAPHSSYHWFAQLQRWGDCTVLKGGVPRRGVPKREVVEHAVRTLNLRDGAELVSWLYGEREAPPTWLLDLRAIPWIDVGAQVTHVAAPVAVADTQAATRAQVGMSAAVATGTDAASVSAPMGRRTRLPSSVRAILADVRDGIVTLEEAERVLGAIFLGPSPPSSWGTGDASHRAKKADGLVVLRGGERVAAEPVLS
jgi:hypothetical protein